MANVKGGPFISRLLWVRINHGEQGVDKLTQVVSPELGAMLRDKISMASWYPFERFVELNLTIDQLFGTGDLGLIKTLGRHGADANLRTIYRLFYKVGTVQWILSRASRLWGLHYDSGTLHLDTYPGKIVGLRIVDFETPHKSHCLSVQGWAERSVELSGGKQVEIREVVCRTEGAQHCLIKARWT